jgi:hypothetical protein
MLRRSSSTPALRFAVVFLFCGGVLATESPRAALAQPEPPRAEVQIQVFKEGDTCFYRIEGQEDQDTFSIRPGGAIDFRATGTSATVTIEPDRQSGFPGTAGAREITLQPGGEAVRLRARGVRGRGSEHKVRIRCPEEAEAAQASAGGAVHGDGMALRFGPDVGRGPSAPQDVSSPARKRSSPAPVLTGGPIMRVDEDG